jgi:hypothetical protein
MNESKADSGAAVPCISLLARVESFLLGLSRMCPSDEGMGGHAPVQAFVAKGIEGRNLLDDVREYLANAPRQGRATRE